MPSEVRTIETDVDSLVSLVKKKKEVSVAEAAKELKQAPQTIEAWANFLEEEGILEIIYKLTTPYLIYIQKEEEAPKEVKPDEELMSIIKLIREAHMHLDRKEASLAKEKHKQVALRLKQMPTTYNEKHSRIAGRLGEIEKTLGSFIKKFTPKMKQDFEKNLSELNRLEDELTKSGSTGGQKEEAKEEEESSETPDSSLTGSEKRMEKKVPLLPEESVEDIQALLKSAYDAITSKDFDVARSKYDRIKRIYEGLPDEFLHRGHKLSENLVKLNSDLTKEMERHYSEEIRSKYSSISELLKSAKKDISKGSLEKAEKTYHEIKGIYATLPDMFFEKKVQLQKEVISVYQDLVHLFDRKAVEQINQGSREIEGLIEEVGKHLKKGEIEQALKKYHTIEATYNSLPHGFLEKKVALESRIIDLNKAILIKGKEAGEKTLKEKTGQILGLLDKGKSLMKDDKINEAVAAYREIVSAYNSIPEGFMDEKTKLQDKIIEFNSELISKSNKISEKDFNSKLQRIKELVQIIDGYVKAKNTDLAEKAYNEIADAYSSMPKGYSEEKARIRESVLEAYKNMVMCSDKPILENADEATVKNYEELLRLLIEVHKRIKHREFDSLEDEYRKMIEYYNKLPLGIVQKKSKIRQEIFRLYNEVLLYKKTKEVDKAVAAGNVAGAKKLASELRENYQNTLKEFRLEPETVEYIKEKYKSYLSYLSKNRVVAPKISFIADKPQARAALQTGAHEARQERKAEKPKLHGLEADHSGRIKSVLAKGKKEKAAASLKEGKLDDALHNLHTLMEIEPEDSEIKIMIGDIKERKKAGAAEKKQAKEQNKQAIDELLTIALFISY